LSGFDGRPCGRGYGRRRGAQVRRPEICPARPAETSQLRKDDGEGQQREDEQDADHHQQNRIADIQQLRKVHLQQDAVYHYFQL